MFAALALASAGCFTDADGRQPDPDRLYFPTGLVTSPGKTSLYVANSDFDLGFAGGSLQVLDLRRLRDDTRVIVEEIAGGSSPAQACAAAGRANNPDPWLNPGPCDAFAVSPYIQQFAFIGAFTSGVLLVHEPEGNRARLFAPVRGDPSITYFDVEDDRGADDSFTPSFQLDCEQADNSFCSAGHRIGQDPDRNLRGVQLPADPVGIAATPDGRAIVSAHQTQGSASLIINDWNGEPQLTYFLSNLSSGPTETIPLPEPAFVPTAKQRADDGGYTFTYRSGFAVTFRSSAELDLLRYVPDSGAIPPRPFLLRDDIVPISINASAFDSRGIALIDSERRTCEAACPTDDLECLVSCAEQRPAKIYMANRNPASLLIGRLETVVNRQTIDGEDVVTGATESAFFYDSVPLNFGASRVEVGHVIDESGRIVERIFAVCFDSRSVFIFNPELEQVEAVIRTGRGPHDIAFDVDTSDPDSPSHAFMYVGHFIDSYLGVVDLDMRRAQTFGQIFATVGQPTPPQESR